MLLLELRCMLSFGGSAYDTRKRDVRTTASRSVAIGVRPKRIRELLPRISSAVLQLDRNYRHDLEEITVAESDEQVSYADVNRHDETPMVVRIKHMMYSIFETRGIS